MPLKSRRLTSHMLGYIRVGSLTQNCNAIRHENSGITSVILLLHHNVKHILSICVCAF